MAYFGGRVEVRPMEKSERHTLEFDNLIIKLDSSSRSKEIKNIQRASFRSEDGERLMHAEMDAGMPTTHVDSVYTLTIIDMNKAEDKIEIPLRAEQLSTVLEFLGRAVRSY